MVKIVDFALAETSDLKPCLQTEKGGPAKGTFRYIVPEILMKKEKYSPG